VWSTKYHVYEDIVVYLIRWWVLEAEAPGDVLVMSKRVARTLVLLACSCSNTT
jgi:hypothetical protein